MLLVVRSMNAIPIIACQNNDQETRIQLSYFEIVQCIALVTM